MISTHEQFVLADKNGKNDLTAEVNWKEDPDVSDCRVFKFILPDGKEAYIDRKHLVEMLFACGKEEEQRSMIPQTVVNVRWYETTLSVKATKDIRKGELITFPVKLSLPAETKNVLGAVKKRRNNFLAP